VGHATGDNDIGDDETPGSIAPIVVGGSVTYPPVFCGLCP